MNVNIANCYDKLGKPLLAIFHFERFMEAKAGSPAQQAEVTAALARLRKQVGTLVLRVTPDGALVIVDREQQRRAPILEPMQLQAGEHTLEVQLEGYATVERKVIVTAGPRSSSTSRSSGRARSRRRSSSRPRRSPRSRSPPWRRRPLDRRAAPPPVSVPRRRPAARARAPLHAHGCMDRGRHLGRSARHRDGDRRARTRRGQRLR